MEELIQYHDTNMEELCDRCGITGEERRRLSTATRNLRTYTKRWLGKSFLYALMKNINRFFLFQTRKESRKTISAIPFCAGSVTNVLIY